MAAHLGDRLPHYSVPTIGGHKSDIGNVHAVIDIDGVLDMTDSDESGKDKDPSNASSGKKVVWASSYVEKRRSLERRFSNKLHKWNSASYCFINSSLPRFSCRP